MDYKTFMVPYYVTITVSAVTLCVHLSKHLCATNWLNVWS